jgi:hypothetical protein
MTTLTDRQRKILDSAKEHGDMYLLPRRFRGRSANPETDLDYAACEALADAGYVRWLGFSSNLAPGVKLTGKP